MRLGYIAQHINAKLECDKEDLVVSGVASLECATQHDITFFYDRKYKSQLAQTKALACVIRKDDLPPEHRFVPLIVDDIYLAVVRLLELFNPYKVEKKKGISRLSYISDSAEIGDDVYIGEFVHIGESSKIGNRTQIYTGVFIDDNVIVGDDCIIYPNVTILKGSEIGSRVIIHSGAVIGSDGFGYFSSDGRILKVPQIGRVIIEDDCEIGSNTTIDRGTVHDTVIGQGCKLDNLVHIAHNVRLGRRCFLAAQVGISGSTVVEDDVLMGGQAGIVGHIRIGKGTRIGAKSGVSKSIKAGGITVFGYPAKEEKRAMRELAALSRITELLPKLITLFKRLDGKNG